MTGFERLEKQAQNEKDIGTTQVVEYLLSRKDLEQHYLNKEKSLKEMRNFIKDKSSKHKQGSWTYVSDSVVLSWAVMYFSLPNSFLKIQSKLLL